MMSKLDLCRLTQPELLSESELCQILTKRCIEIKDFEKFSKTELIEMYKRVAMPLPQRQYWDRKSKDNEGNMNGNSELEEWSENMALRNPNFNESDNISSRNFFEKRKKISEENLTNLLMSSVDETKSVSKKIRLSTPSEVELDCNGINKHKTNEKKNEDSASTSIRKRQKITWP